MHVNSEWQSSHPAQVNIKSQQLLAPVHCSTRAWLAGLEDRRFHLTSWAESAGWSDRVSTECLEWIYMCVCVCVCVSIHQLPVSVRLFGLLWCHWVITGFSLQSIPHHVQIPPPAPVLLAQNISVTFFTSLSSFSHMRSIMVPQVCPEGGFQLVCVLLWLTRPSSAWWRAAACCYLSVAESGIDSHGCRCSTLEVDETVRRSPTVCDVHQSFLASYQSFCACVFLGSACCDWRHCASPLSTRPVPTAQASQD